MIFLSEMRPGLLATRHAGRKLRSFRGRRQESAEIRCIKYLTVIFLFLVWAIPLQGQNDLVLRASDLMRAGKFHDAELLWRQLTQQHPKDAVAYGNLGVALAQQGKLEQAATEYRKSLTLKVGGSYPDSTTRTSTLFAAD